MSSDAAVLKFIAVVELHFPRPKFNGDEQMESAWLKSMHKVLAGYSDEIVALAAERILLSRSPKRDGRFFPSPMECIEACDKAAAYRQQEATPLLSGPKEMPYDARVRLARDLMRCPMGQAAIKDGWGQSMFQFCIDNQRVPGGREIDECKITSRQFAAEYERLLRGDHPMRGPLAKLAEGMMRKARAMMGEKAA
jgi:hypothetical protein